MERMIKIARKAVEVLEAIEGQPFADALADALAKTSESRAVAEVAVFPMAMKPTSADVVASLERATSRFSNSGYARDLAALHRNALESWPEFSEAIRGHQEIEDSAQAARSLAHTVADQQEAADTARSWLMAELAGQLAETGHELAAAYVESLALCARAATCRESLETAAAEALAAAEVLRLEVEAKRCEESERLASEAEAEATRISGEGKSASARALKLRSEALADRVRSSGLSQIRVGRELYDTEHLLRSLPGTSLEFMSRVNAALTEAKQ